jgi:hypothetical protein
MNTKYYECLGTELTKQTSIARLDLYMWYRESSSQYVHLVVFSISGEITNLLAALLICAAAGQISLFSEAQYSLSHSLQISLSYSTKRQAEHLAFCFFRSSLISIGHAGTVLSSSKSLFSLWIYRFRGILFVETIVVRFYAG